MVNGLDIENAAEKATKLANDERYSNRVKHWQAQVSETPEQIHPLLHGANLGRLALEVGLDTPVETADVDFNQVVKILSSDRLTNFDNALQTLRELKEKSAKK